MKHPKKSTIVRFRNGATRLFFTYGEYLVPRLAGRLARDLWFAAPPRMADLPVPPGGESFTVTSQGATIGGQAWGSGDRTVYLMHGWGGRGSQFGALVEPLTRAGYRAVLFDAPAHGASDPGPGGRRTNGVEFARALDDVFARFGPADAVIAHSMGTISTYLALNDGWLGTRRLVFVAPMVEAVSLFNAFQQALGFGHRTRRAFDRAVDEFIGLPITEFDARIQAARTEARPTLVLTDRGDRQTPYDDVVDFAQSIGAPLVTTEGLGHRKILRDPAVVQRIVEFVGGTRDGGELEEIA
ncbi:MAG: alpha/beta hydrolase [Nocardioidaceae bacterium]|nr:alpha/beta hydrolase [Nocardioidaceae bacterium]